jgi:predicted GTPase
MPVTADRPELVADKRVLVIEDGPTLTHGGMAYGAGALAAQKLGARELVDPRPYAVGSIRAAFERYPHIGPLLPALGYGEKQVGELAETIRRTPCDAVLIATPVDLRRVIDIAQPVCRASYEYADRGEPTLGELVTTWIRSIRRRA